MTGKQTQWLDYLPSPVLAVRATCHFCAAAMQDGSLNVYSHTGRRYVHFRLWKNFKTPYIGTRIMPTINLGAPCSFMDANKHSLLVITSAGVLFSW